MCMCNCFTDVPQLYGWLEHTETSNGAAALEKQLCRHLSPGFTQPHPQPGSNGTSVPGLQDSLTSGARLLHSVSESRACMHWGPTGAHLSQACRMPPLAGCSRARPLTVSLKAANASKMGAEPSLLLPLELSPPNPMPPGDASEMPKTTRMRVTNTATLRRSRGCACGPAGACRAAVR